MNTERKPDTYLMTAVSFGDKPAGNIAILALRKTAEMGKAEYPQAADVITRSTYVDDIIDSEGSLDEAKRLTNEMDKLIEPGGFKIKHWIIGKPEEYSHS